MVSPGIARLAGISQEHFEAVMDAVLWNLPRTHKGFRCQYEQDHIRRAFERVAGNLAAPWEMSDGSDPSKRPKTPSSQDTDQ